MPVQQLRNLESGSDYHFPVVDPFTPRADQAGDLDTNVRNGPWGDTPLSYVLWFDNLWFTGDPTGWGPEVFTPDAVMIDPTGTSTGAGIAASDFKLLFRFFPELRGEVVSWSRNNSEIFINWRFVVQNDRTCPVIDKFSFVEGRVSFRQAYFDTFTLLSYLASNYGTADLYDYFTERFLGSFGRGNSYLFIPSLVRAFGSGLFRWSSMPLPPPRRVAVTPEPAGIRVRWSELEGARSYRVKRGTDPKGPFHWVAAYEQGTEFLDKTAEAGKTYFYVVSSNRSDKPLLATPPPMLTPKDQTAGEA